MKAHDLARALLAGPNVPVAATFDDAPDYATEVGFDKVERRRGDHGIEQEVVILTYHRDSNVFEAGEEFDLDAPLPERRSMEPKTADEALAVLRALAENLAASNVEGVAAVGEAETTNLRSVSGADYGFPTSE